MWSVAARLQDSSTLEEEITAAVVACGTDHTATISRRGQLFTWGLGNSGELAHEEVSQFADALASAWHASTASACRRQHAVASHLDTAR